MYGLELFQNENLRILRMALPQKESSVFTYKTRSIVKLGDLLPEMTPEDKPHHQFSAADPPG